MATVATSTSRMATVHRSPFIVLASLKVGSFFVGESGEILIDFDNISFDSIKNHLLQYIVGSTILATFMAVLLGLICYLILNFYNRKATA